MAMINSLVRIKFSSKIKMSRVLCPQTISHNRRQGEFCWIWALSGLREVACFLFLSIWGLDCGGLRGKLAVIGRAFMLCGFLLFFCFECLRKLIPLKITRHSTPLHPQEANSALDYMWVSGSQLTTPHKQPRESVCVQAGVGACQYHSPTGIARVLTPLNRPSHAS